MGITAYTELGSSTDVKSGGLVYAPSAIFPFITTALVNEAELEEVAVPAS